MTASLATGALPACSHLPNDEQMKNIQAAMSKMEMCEEFSHAFADVVPISSLFDVNGYTTDSIGYHDSVNKVYEKLDYVYTHGKFRVYDSSDTHFGIDPCGDHHGSERACADKLTYTIKLNLDSLGRNLESLPSVACSTLPHEAAHLVASLNALSSSDEHDERYGSNFDDAGIASNYKDFPSLLSAFGKKTSR